MASQFLKPQELVRRDIPTPARPEQNLENSLLRTIERFPGWKGQRPRYLFLENCVSRRTECSRLALSTRFSMDSRELLWEVNFSASPISSLFFGVVHGVLLQWTHAARYSIPPGVPAPSLRLVPAPFDLARRFGLADRFVTRLVIPAFGFRLPIFFPLSMEFEFLEVALQLRSGYANPALTRTALQVRQSPSSSGSSSASRNSTTKSFSKSVRS